MKPVDRHEPILNGDATVLRADRKRCPVCGHPSGDCRGASPAPKKVAGLGTIPWLEEKQTILVERDVYEDRVLTGGMSVRVLVAKSGSQISLKRARELGLF